MMKLKKSHFIVIIIAVILVGSTLYFLYNRNQENICSLGMEIPPDDMFLNAKSSELCKDFDISFTYDDSSSPTISDGVLFQEIIWSLDVKPKDGVEAKDFYCTLVLNNWIVSKSSSPSLLYMGLSKSLPIDMPSESTSLNSVMQKYIDIDITRLPEYESQIKTPVYIMLSFNNNKEYYVVTPEFKKFEDGGATSRPS